MTGEQGDGGQAGEHGLRRDAVANQERVLAAAVTTMLREGRHVPMATVAAEAGVGVATLYRRYPTREDLLQALTERSFAKVLAVAEEAAGRDGSAVAALDWFLDRTIDQRSELVLPLHGGPSELSAGASAARAELHRVMDGILERGRRDGSVQADVTPSDVVMLGEMLAQPLSSVDGWDRIARRQKQLFLRGVRK